MSLSSVTALQGVPGITDLPLTVQQLQQAIDAASDAIKRYTNRKLEKALYVEFCNGQGTPDLVLRQRPVYNDASLEVRYDPIGYAGQKTGSFASTTILTQGQDYMLVTEGTDDAGAQISKSGIVRRIAGSGTTLEFSSFDFWGGWSGYRGTLTARQAPFWYRGYGNVKVTYNAGFSPIPADLIQATNQLAAWLLRSGIYGGQSLSSESLNGYSYGLAALQAQPQLGEVRQLLARFREEAVGLGV